MINEGKNHSNAAQIVRCHMYAFIHNNAFYQLIKYLFMYDLKPKWDRSFLY